VTPPPNDYGIKLSIKTATRREVNTDKDMAAFSGDLATGNNANELGLDHIPLPDETKNTKADMNVVPIPKASDGNVDNKKSDSVVLPDTVVVPTVAVHAGGGREKKKKRETGEDIGLESAVNIDMMLPSSDGPEASSTSPIQDLNTAVANTKNLSKNIPAASTPKETTLDAKYVRDFISSMTRDERE
jgi:hypothetical protein